MKNFKNKNIIQLLQLKKFNEQLENDIYSSKFKFKFFFDNIYECNYISYNIITRRIFWHFYKSGNFIGINFMSHYQLDLSKRTWSLQKNLFMLKILSKKDSRFYYGLCVAKKNNFLASTALIWNVFYNEIIEKWLFLFSDRNESISQISFYSINQIIFSKFKKNNFWWKFFFLRSKPWADSKIWFKL